MLKGPGNMMVDRRKVKAERNNIMPNCHKIVMGGKIETIPRGVEVQGRTVSWSGVNVVCCGDKKAIPPPSGAV